MVSSESWLRGQCVPSRSRSVAVNLFNCELHQTVARASALSMVAWLVVLGLSIRSGSTIGDVIEATCLVGAPAGAGRDPLLGVAVCWDPVRSRCQYLENKLVDFVPLGEAIS